MDDTSVKIEIIEDMANRSLPTFIKMNTDENVVINEPGVIQESIDTTDKRSPNYTAKQVNSFAAKKTVAQGMMDVALITANANQLRYLIEYQRNSPTFYLIMILIAISLSLQVAVGISLIFKGRFDIKGKSKSVNAQKINNYVVVGVFLITIINVFIAAFSITVPSTEPLPVMISTNR
ncbi:ninjurin-1 [Ooceraea biroi]|uniref:Ninjurin-1 n=1 Tax=Ooceraea biroi TaxID=2015173 RepID=A0A026W595_OOCBI|nr:ninjurin-1 [Ooceraea biroi]EZA51168.1 Ninjurin-1 [Ooceraea biroi]